MNWKITFIILLFPIYAGAQIVNVTLHPDGIETNEPCIAIDPKYPGTQILGSNTSYFFISQDGGQTWSLKLTKPEHGFYGDPVVLISRFGDFYLCHLAKNKNLVWPEQFDRIVFEKSTDAGVTFTSAGVGNNPGKVQDKPWISLDEGKKSKYRDRIYLSWTEFDKYGSTKVSDSSRIRLAYSSDYGASFSNGVVVSDSSGDAKDDDNTLEGATTASGKKGEVYVAWAGKHKIWFDASSDGGQTWGTDRVLAEQIGGWNIAGFKGGTRANSMPFMAADCNGHLYVVFGDSRNGDQDIYYVFSKDKGKTWTPPIRVNNDPVKNGKDQYMPNIGVDRKTGKVYAAWYDRRHSDNNLFTDVYLAELNGTKPGKNIRVTDQPFCMPSNKIFAGDYISIAAAKKEIRVAYTVYDSEKQIATVLVGMLQHGAIKKQKSPVKGPYILLQQLKDTGLVYIHLSLPGYKSCTVELRRGEQLFYKQLFDPLLTPEQEVLLPVSHFATGVYKLSLSFKGRKIEQDIYLEKR